MSRKLPTKVTISKSLHPIIFMVARKDGLRRVQGDLAASLP